jgi:hypothetical protein
LKPEDVPAELVGMACKAAYGGVWAFSDERYVITRALAAVLAEHERMIREQVAKEIDREREADDDGSSWGGGMLRAAEVARRGRP